MILVTGESLIDMIRSNESKQEYRAVAGGSPFNVAMALGRQDIPVRFLGRFSSDQFGVLLRETLESSQVKLDLCCGTSAPSTIGFANTTQTGVDYTFYTDDTAGCAISPNDCPEELPEEIRVLHFGSFSLGLNPIAETVDHLLQPSIRRDRIVSIDPNIRPFLITDENEHRKRLARQLSCANIIKLSDEDLEWLHPGMSPEEFAKNYLENGAQLVAVTMGENGAFAATQSGTVHRAIAKGEIVDTVGAGDTFQASILAWLYRNERMSATALSELSDTALSQMLQYAVRAAAVNCSRLGCDPPWCHELQ